LDRFFPALAAFVDGKIGLIDAASGRLRKNNRGLDRTPTGDGGRQIGRPVLAVVPESGAKTSIAAKFLSGIVYFGKNGAEEEHSW
jgi:hypothetical protein